MPNNNIPIINQENQTPATDLLDLTVVFAHNPAVPADSTTVPVKDDGDELVELEPLNADEQSTLERCETVVRNFKQSFKDLAIALYEIKRLRLYRGNYQSFPEYCEEAHAINRSYAYRLAAAGKHLTEKLTMGNSELPATERATRKDMEAQKQSQTTRKAKEGNVIVPDAPSRPEDSGSVPTTDDNHPPALPVKPDSIVIVIPRSAKLTSLSQLYLSSHRAHKIISDPSRLPECMDLLYELTRQLKKYAELEATHQEASGLPNWKTH